MLVLVIGAAVGLLVSAPALGAPTLIETAALTAAGIQHSPAIAVDPAATRAVVVADDGATAPPPQTTAVSTADWSTSAWSSPPTSLPHSSGSTSAGQADVAWGMAGTANVYAVELGRNSSSGSLCTSQSGIFFSASSTAGASYDSALVVTAGSSFSQAIEPAIAVDRTVGRVYVAYTRLDWGSPGCPGTPDSSQIWLAYSDIAAPGFGTTWTIRRVSPLATSGSARYRSPALDVLPDGRVVVAFRNDAAASPQIESETCTSPSPGANYCNPPSAGNVGAGVVLGDATAPALVSGLVGPPTPSVVAAGGRVSVAWHASVGGAVRAFAAMSTNGGASYGPAQQIDPAGAGNQVAPELAATPGGRVDAAYLWDAGSGSVAATVASAGPPLASATTEAWAQPVVVQSAAASSATPIAGQAAPLGQGLGVATAPVSTPPSPLPPTLVAFTDTAAGNQDVHVVGLLHGTTAPVIPTQTVRASKNVTTIVHVAASDDDGDPLTWSSGPSTGNPFSSVGIADAARGDFAFKASPTVGPDTFEAIVTDGVTGHEARALINVDVHNDPPVIGCRALVAREDTPYPIPIDDCVSDPNGDALTIDLTDAKGGSVERIAGTWRFIPLAHSTATGSFVLHASDGDMSAEQLITVTVVKPAGKVTLKVKDAGRRREIARGAALRFEGTAVDARGPITLLNWDFGDGTAEVRGTKVAHRFRREGSYTVKVTASGASVSVKVLVRRRAVELLGAPSIVDGVMTLRVRTRVAGKLSMRVDSRSRTMDVPAASTQQTLSIQVTTGPLARLTLRLRPAKATKVPGLTLRRLVLVSPRSAG
ncbi:MAG: large repetitive protein [Gaiellales bacterium]|nr:large repetitive protein [Gaiellales bacterium]